MSTDNYHYYSYCFKPTFIIGIIMQTEYRIPTSQQDIYTDSAVQRISEWNDYCSVSSSGGTKANRLLWLG